MWWKFSLAFVVAVIGGMILSIAEVDAQSTVDDSASCESPTLDEAVNLIKRGFQDVRLIREDCRDVNLIREDLKKYVRSNEQQSNESCVSKRDFEDLKTACTSHRQQSSTVNASSLCEYRTRLLTVLLR